MTMKTQLKDIADNATCPISQQTRPICVLIYPEGTVVSDEERLASKTFASKSGIPDCRNVLLPRSTGLLTCLHALAPQLPNLQVLDVTVGYSGVPENIHPHTVITLRRTFLMCRQPRRIHMHLRLLPLRPRAEDEKTPDLISVPTPRSPTVSDEDKDIFKIWLIDLWRDKDRRLDGFHAKPTKPLGAASVEFQLQMRSPAWDTVELVVRLSLLPVLLYKLFRM